MYVFANLLVSNTERHDATSDEVHVRIQICIYLMSRCDVAGACTRPPPASSGRPKWCVINYYRRMEPHQDIARSIFGREAHAYTGAGRDTQGKRAITHICLLYIGTTFMYVAFEEWRVIHLQSRWWWWWVAAAEDEQPYVTTNKRV